MERGGALFDLHGRALVPPYGLGITGGSPGRERSVGEKEVETTARLTGWRGARTYKTVEKGTHIRRSSSSP